MKGTHLGEFQEFVMLCILILDDAAYGVSIQEEIELRMKRSISRGALQTALTRLEEKGFLTSEFGAATPKRGGKRKRIYSATQEAHRVLQEIKASLCI